MSRVTKQNGKYVIKLTLGGYLKVIDIHIGYGATLKRKILFSDKSEAEKVLKKLSLFQRTINWKRIQSINYTY